MGLRSAKPYILFFVLVFAFAPGLAVAADEWISVRSKSFFLIGNAPEREIRQVAIKLEQFHATFKLLFPGTRFDGSGQTNVIVFRNSGSYRPFKPKRADGKADRFVAGYFQPGEDVNYITLSADGSKEDTYGIIFHEYVHFLVDSHFGRSRIPPWFNEGLAEYYQTFEIKDDQKVYLGKIQNEHLFTLQRFGLIPFDKYFRIDNNSLHQNGHNTRSVFYAQSWALVHFLIQGGQNKRLSRFVDLVMKDNPPEKAFQSAFGQTYKEMEGSLRRYVRQRKFQVHLIRFNKKLDFDTQLEIAPLGRADANAYLGDLLYHTREYSDAEIYLKKSLAEDNGNALANTAYGLVRMRQGRFSEAKRFLERAVSGGGSENHYAQYNYAYVLSRESLDEFGLVSRFPSAQAAKMREALKRSIEINPRFAPSYHLLAFINLVNNEFLDEAVTYVRKGLSIHPGNEEYQLLLARIYLRQERVTEAEKIARRIAKSGGGSRIIADAENLLRTVEAYKETRAAIEKNRKEMEASGTKPPIIVNRSDLTEDEVLKIERESLINRLNRAITPVASGEERVTGYLDKLECVAGKPRFSVRSGNRKLLLASPDFESLDLLALDEDAEAVVVGCGAGLGGFKIVFTFRPDSDPEAKSDGRLLGMVFVPRFFHLKTSEELEAEPRVIIVDRAPRQVTQAKSAEELAERRKKARREALERALRRPREGESRFIGVLRRLECKRKYNVFVVEVNGREMRLRNRSPADLRLVSYTPEAGGMNFRCGAQPPPVRSVITFRKTDDKKVEGDLISIEFVPRWFEIDDR